jgi:hypothetical protein
LVPVAGAGHSVQDVLGEDPIMATIPTDDPGCPAAEFDYDLAISATKGVAADFTDSGVPAPSRFRLATTDAWPALIGIGAGLVTLGVGLVSATCRRAGGHDCADPARLLGVAVAPLAVTVVVSGVGYAVASGLQDPEALGPGDITVEIDIEYSRFVPDHLTVA